MSAADGAGGDGGPILEIIRFRAREGAERSLLELRADAVAALAEAFGLEHSTLCRREGEREWLDVMHFPSAAAADRAEAEEMGLPAFAAWVANVEAVVGRERAFVAGR